MEGSAKTESELITRYRHMSMQPEVSQAIDDIVNEAISVDTNDRVVEISLGETVLSDKVSKLMVWSALLTIKTCDTSVAEL